MKRLRGRLVDCGTLIGTVLGAILMSFVLFCVVALLILLAMYGLLRWAG